MFAFGRIGFFIPMGFVAALSACATGRVNLVDAGAEDVQVENTSTVRIQGVTVLAEGEETVVYGRIRRLLHWLIRKVQASDRVFRGWLWRFLSRRKVWWSCCGRGCSG